MAHVLILGMTESGKTTLALRLAARYKQAGCGILVLDPIGDPRWHADFITSDPEEFLRVFWNSQRCMAFIDESGDAVGRYDRAMIKTATRGRHWGHSCHYITQRAVDISRTVRDQCTQLFLFASSINDGKVHAQEWNKPELQNCHTLKRGEYYSAPRFGQLTKGAVFITHTNTHTGAQNDSGTDSGGDRSNDSRVSIESEGGQAGGGLASGHGQGEEQTT